MSLTPFLVAAFALAALLALFALLQARGAGRSWRARRRAGASARVVVGLVLLGCAGFAALVGTALLGWRRLAAEAHVATIDTRALDAQRYVVGVELPDGTRREVELAGDEWQLDARVLKWKGWANLLGLDAQYRLERVSGRYRDIEQERKDERTVYGLSENPGLDLWTMSIDHKRWLPFVDAVYGSAVYLPMADGARYEVAITQSGLVARPVNDVAKAAAGNWK